MLHSPHSISRVSRSVQSIELPLELCAILSPGELDRPREGRLLFDFSTLLHHHLLDHHPPFATSPVSLNAVNRSYSIRHYCSNGDHVVISGKAPFDHQFRIIYALSLR